MPAPTKEQISRLMSAMTGKSEAEIAAMSEEERKKHMFVKMDGGFLSVFRRLGKGRSKTKD